MLTAAESSIRRGQRNDNRFGNMESLETLTLIFLGLDLGWNKGRLECTKERMGSEGKMSIGIINLLQNFSCE